MQFEYKVFRIREAANPSSAQEMLNQAATKGFRLTFVDDGWVFMERGYFPHREEEEKSAEENKDEDNNNS